KGAKTLVADILPLRYKFAEAAESVPTGVQDAQAEALHGPAKERVGKPGLTVTPVGWFSDRKRIPPHSGIRVARFQVWQELSAGPEGDVAPLAPLHATIMFELSNEWFAGLSRPNGAIRLQNPKCAEIIEAGLMLHHASYDLESAH